LADDQTDMGIKPRWPDFGRTATLNAAACCALLSSISAGELMYGLVADVPATLYGSEDVDVSQLRASELDIGST